jgi:hypothetical protein
VDQHAGDRLPMWERLFMPLAMLFTLFGVVAMFSIGLPFVILGLGMIALWPLRSRRNVFTSLVLGLFAFVLVGVLVAPGGCTATATASGTGGAVTCTNLLGIDYAGTVPYSAPLWPALLAGAGADALVTAVTLVSLERGRSA